LSPSCYLRTSSPPMPSSLPNTTLFRSHAERLGSKRLRRHHGLHRWLVAIANTADEFFSIASISARHCVSAENNFQAWNFHCALQDRKSTRLNSSHGSSSYGVFCLKKKK